MTGPYGLRPNPTAVGYWDVVGPDGWQIRRRGGTRGRTHTYPTRDQAAVVAARLNDAHARNARRQARREQKETVG